MRSTWLIVIGTLLLTAGFLWVLFSPLLGEGAFLADEAAPIHAQQWNAFPNIAPASVTCSLAYTTTDRTPMGNHSFSTAAALANYTGQALVEGGIGSVQTPHEDYYRLDNALIGNIYTVRAVPDKTVNYDLAIIVYDNTYTAILTDSNPFTGNFAEVTLTAENAGPYFFRVFQRSEQCQGSTYSLVLSAVSPTSTPTPTFTPSPTPTGIEATPTPFATPDRYEPNYDFSTATTIATDVTYDLNFVPWGGAEVDNDFFKLWVKPGLIFTCETFDLDPGVDTNMRMFDANYNPLGGNDDRELGDYSSLLSYYSTYEGFLYIEVGQGNRMDLPSTVNSNYSLRCEMSVPGTPTPRPVTVTPAPDKDDDDPTPAPTATRTPTPTGDDDDPTPTPTGGPEGESSPIATPTSPGTGGNTIELTFRPLTTPAPATPTPTPTGFRSFGVIIYYDGNNDGNPGAGEGIPGFFVRVLSPESGEELARGYTDEQGRLSFNVATVGAVRIVVPLLGYDQFIGSATPEVIIRIAPLPLPQTIP